MKILLSISLLLGVCGVNAEPPAGMRGAQDQALEGNSFLTNDVIDRVGKIYENYIRTSGSRPHSSSGSHGSGDTLGPFVARTNGGGSALPLSSIGPLKIVDGPDLAPVIGSFSFDEPLDTSDSYASLGSHGSRESNGGRPSSNQGYY